MRIDGRTLTHVVSESIRLIAVRRLREGEAASTVVASYSLSRTTIYTWLKSANAGGKSALKASKHAGSGFKLSDAQRRKVRSWICGKVPRQHGFDFGLWTRSIIAELIRRRFGISLGLTAVGCLLARSEITPQQRNRPDLSLLRSGRAPRPSRVHPALVPPSPLNPDPRASHAKDSAPAPLPTDSRPDRSAGTTSRPKHAPSADR